MGEGFLAFFEGSGGGFVGAFEGGADEAGDEETVRAIFGKTPQD
jgi:hypothetical protein